MLVSFTWYDGRLLTYKNLTEYLASVLDWSDTNARLFNPPIDKSGTLCVGRFRILRRNDTCTDTDHEVALRNSKEKHVLDG